jgi:phage terminase Nu1 subunit (DNA packaging protein)
MKPLSPPESLPKEFSAAELRYCLNLTAGRLSQLEQGGIIARTRPGFYAGDSIRNYINFLRRSGEGLPKDWQTARVELAREKLALLRLERRQKGELLEKSAVSRLNTEIATTIKNRLLAVPRATAPRLLHLSRPMEAEEVTNGAICEALEELASLQFVTTKRV